MASVRVAVRVRPLNQREIELKSTFIIEMNDKTTTITNLKIPEHSVGDTGRERLKQFTYDFSYWTVDKNSPKYVSQQQVFQDLGMDVVKNSYDGYNTCVFAYGQTGSGKTYTMMGNKGDEGLIPRSCEELFRRMTDENMTYRTEVSYLEIYNEKVRDLLTHGAGGDQHNLRVREHPVTGPYVEGLSQHIVGNYSEIRKLMDKGNQNRTTASTNMNDVSSRSHAIFSIFFTQAKFSKECPTETHSKIHLVDLAGSERAVSTGATGQRLKEGGSINKSLVTLANVISALAESSSTKRKTFIPYRDSTLTWLLKDSLGGNAKTMMIATVSPANVNYAETLSTLRYANRAKDIINKPTVNEDPNVKLIRELRTEIARLKAMLGGHIDSISEPKLKNKLHENEARIKVLTQEWAGKWTEIASLLESDKNLGLRKEGLGVVLDSELPHLIGIDDDLLSTGIMLYHLEEGNTRAGSNRNDNKTDIVLYGPDIELEHCSFLHQNGEVTLVPGTEAACSVNGNVVTEPLKLSQGAVILLGQTNMFRFNNPAQIAKLKQEYKGSGLTMSRISLSQSMTDLCRSTESLALAPSGWDFDGKHTELMEQLESKRQEIEEMEEKYQLAESARCIEQEQKNKALEESRLQLEKLQMELKGISGHGVDLEVEKSRLKSIIEEELGKLVKTETCKIQEAQEQKDNLTKELQALQLKCDREKTAIESELEQLKQKKLKLDENHSKINREVEDAKSTVANKQKDLDKHKAEYSALETLMSAPEEFDRLSSQLSESVKEVLQRDNQQLCLAQNTLKANEKDCYNRYKQQLADAEKQKELTLQDLAIEREQLEADKVYIQECEDRLKETLQEDDETYAKEKGAIEAEKKRIAGVESDLQLVESSLDEYLNKAQIEEDHAKEIETLNKERDAVRTMMRDWKDSVDVQLEASSRNCDAARREVISGTEKLEYTLIESQGQRGQMQQEEQRLSRQVNEKENELQHNLSAFQQQTERMEENRKVKQELNDAFLQDLTEKKNMLNSVDVDGIDDETELRNAWIQVQCTCVKGSDDTLKQLEQRFQELFDLEKQFDSSACEVEEKMAELESARQEENDSLETQRFALQELEEQERINSLVEQEIKRRLFEERVEREKQRRIEREREKAERDRELGRIKKAHQKELSRLKEKIESSDGAMENTPTRANPYASVMSGDATPTSSSGLRKTKSVSRTNLARAQSSSSVVLPSKPVTVSVPGFVLRGSGFDSHVEFEVKISVLDETWSVFRRYSKFRELHNDLKSKFPEVGALVFPPKKWFGNNSEKVASERRMQLELYLSHVVDVLQTESQYPLHPAHAHVYSKQVLWDFHHFFRKGLFENTKHGTG